MNGSPTDAMLHEGDAKSLLVLTGVFAERRGPIAPMQSMRTAETAAQGYAYDQVLAERTLSVNTIAARDNADLMTLVWVPAETGAVCASIGLQSSLLKISGFPGAPLLGRLTHHNKERYADC